MKSTSGKIAYTQQPDDVEYLKPIASEEKGENFYEHLQHIWSKVMLLKEVAIIENENDKFNYAYRFAELELEKVCKENASLRKRINELLASY